MAQQSRPEPMNASPHHPKVKTSLKLTDTLCVAGGQLSGKMEMECKADKGLGIGMIMVELFAIEELTSRDHSATQTFLHSTRLFQGPGLPPSNAVHPYPRPGDPALPPNYFPARKGTTTFLFQFPLPPSSPSSINFGSGLATLKYEVRASVGVSWKGERRVVTDKKEVDIVESLYEDEGGLRISGDPEGVVVGENGKMWVQGRVVGGFIVAGQPACVELHVKNHSTKKNSGLSVTLTRELQLPIFSSSSKPPLQLSDTLTNVSFRGQEYVILPGSEGVANLVFDVPRNARGVKGGKRHGDEEDQAGKTSEPLFEVRCIVGVKLGMGFGSKDIRLEIPVTILHPAAVPELPPIDDPTYPIPPMYPYSSTPAPDMSMSPLSHTPYPIPPTSPPYALPTSPMPHPGSPIYHSPPPMSPMPSMSPPYAADIAHIQPWEPPSAYDMYYNNISPYPLPPHTPQPAYYDHTYGLVPPPSIPAALPIRPSSAEPVPSQPLYSHSPVSARPLPPPGLPLSAVQQPLPSLIAGPAAHHPLRPPIDVDHNVPVTIMNNIPPAEPEREEGKGERATRISYHLRMSSRTRSVSPQAHRFGLSATTTMASGAATAGDDTHLRPPDQVQTHQLDVPSPHSQPTSSPRQAPMHISIPPASPLSASSPEVLSPRPIPSPTKAPGISPFSPSSPSKSSRVATLERMASQAVRVNKDMSTSVPDVKLVDQEKTLPVPPVPSVKNKSSRSVSRESQGGRARANSLFPPAPLEDAPPDETPPTPTLAAIASLKPPRSVGRGGGGMSSSPSGLDALEARLLAEVGTRKAPPPSLSPNANTNAKPDVRSVLPDLPPLPAPISIPRPLQTDSANDSAISSLTLAGLEGEDSAMLHAGNIADRRTSKGSPAHSDGIHHDGEMTERGRSRNRDWDWPHEYEQDHEKNSEQPKGAHPSQTTANGKSSQKKRKGEGKKDVEVHKLRKAAQGRVADWLGKIDPAAAPPEVVSSSEPSPARADDSPLNVSPTPAAERSKVEDAQVEKEEAKAEVKVESKDESKPDDPATAEPNPRSSGFVPMETIRARQRQAFEEAVKTGKSPSNRNALAGRFPVYPPRPSNAEVKYDIRSARGGRGGKVTAVAAIWASQVQAAQQQTSNSKSPSPQPVRGVKSPLGKPASSPKTVSPPQQPQATKTPLSRPPQASTPTATPFSAANLSANRAKLIKSSSVPAVVSSSLATPMLSSTASLARPSPPANIQAKHRTKLPPVLAASFQTQDKDVGGGKVDQSTAPKPISAPKAELAFGQARLRELIKKYQGQTSS
ncbi:hypothetical protein K474DRAFT_1661914 [Panus rudis PR-1116 ss-1]|nr:hypothetical protein K474DRAFT_1661914 [Panus rudis PR-1116 ss-1]